MMVKTKLRYYTYKVTFKDLPCYFYYGKHKDNGKPYLGSPKTWRHLWDQFEPEIQILQWYETAKDVEEAERSLIKSTWKQTWNGKNYSLNENLGGFPSEDVLRECGQKVVSQQLGIHNPLNHEKVLEGRRKGGRNVSKETHKKAGLVGGRKTVEQKLGWHGMSHEEKVQTGSQGGKKSVDLKLGIHGISQEERLRNCSNAGKVGGKTTGSDNVKLSRGICSPESRAKKRKPVMCLETGVIYDSTMAASNVTKINGGNINSCCRGERETAGGFHWKRVTPDG